MKKAVCTLKLTRNGGGIKLFIKGDPTMFNSLEDKAYGGECAEIWVGSPKVRRVPASSFPGVNAVFGTQKLMHNGVPNLWFIMAKDLAEGVTFEVPGLISADLVREYTTAFQAAISQLYRLYLSPLDVVLDVTTSVREELPS